MTSIVSTVTAACAIAGITGSFAYAALAPQSQLFGKILIAPPHPHQLALTFDDGPNPAATPQLLEVLARHRARATFFLIGNFVRQQPALTREIAAAGHLIGNHTMSHPWLPFHSSARIRAELAGCNAALEDTLGRKMTLFRPPHGARRPAVLRAAAELGLQTVQWNLIVGDWSVRSASVLLDRIQRGIARNRRRSRGTNIVLHDGGHTGLGQPRLHTVAAVDGLLSNLQDTVFVTPPGWTGLSSA